MGLHHGQAGNILQQTDALWNNRCTLSNPYTCGTKCLSIAAHPVNCHYEFGQYSIHLSTGLKKPGKLSPFKRLNSDQRRIRVTLFLNTIFFLFTHY